MDSSKSRKICQCFNRLFRIQAKHKEHEEAISIAERVKPEKKPRASILKDPRQTLVSRKIQPKKVSWALEYDEAKNPRRYAIEKYIKSEKIGTELSQKANPPLRPLSSYRRSA